MAKKRYVLQLCHNYQAPFGDVARQWKVLFNPAIYDVITVFMSGDEDKSVANLIGGEVFFLGYRSTDLKGLKLKIISDVKKLVDKFQFELVVAQRYKSAYVALKASSAIPVIGVAHAYGVYKRYFRRLFANINRQRLFIVGVSKAVAEDINKDLFFYPTQNIMTVYNHIDTEHYLRYALDRSAARQSLGINQKRLIIGNVGRLHPDKDQYTLIEGFARWMAIDASPDDALLVIIGSGALEADLVKLAKSKGLEDSVLFLGNVKNAWQYFKAFDIFALSSNHEPFGMVLLEALIAGVPIIAADSGGAPEVLSENDELFTTGDPIALSAGLQKLHAKQHDPDTQIDHVEKNFSDQALKRDFQPILEQLIGS